ncbi:MULTISPECIES: S-layer homology domain-containing protein [Paenibacillus]|uniref:S-layer homology domain-containing protein n=1 Tax=Paenibacillus TaxID=44249 RepID=UPI0022B8DADB|nr:S-layer homology domain-containing protein [Paenibacillus caseinilyticus]MCZ8522192.1 S-layer homology domain-containing protein [Paenibacillus caseinilyticus]
MKKLSKRIIPAFLSTALLVGGSLPAAAAPVEIQNQNLAIEPSNLLLAPSLQLQGLSLSSVQLLQQKGFTVTENKETGAPRFLMGSLSARLNSDDAVLQYVSLNQQVFGLKNAASELGLVKKSTDGIGQTHYLYQQQYRGVPVYGKYINLHLDESKKTYAIQNQLQGAVSGLSVDVTPSLSGQEAIGKLQTDLEAKIGQAITLGGKLGEEVEVPLPAAKLVVYPFGGQTHLAYEVNFSYIQPEFGSWVGFVDAHTGAILHTYNNLHREDGPVTSDNVGHRGDTKKLNALRISDRYYLADITKRMAQEHPGHDNPGYLMTYDYRDLTPQGTLESPISSASPVFNSKAGTMESHGVDAHYYAGQVYDFYLNEFGRNSLDGKGMNILSIVHVPGSTNESEGLDNAFWMGGGINAIYYGDGKALDCLACAGDVVAHELTHGVTEFSAGLVYENQSGALNEAYSDILASVFDSNDWLLGEDTGAVVRSLENPSDYGQPEHMDQYQELYDDAVWGDNGGVHINSGIPNHAAYLIAKKIDALNIAGWSGHKVLGQLAYNSLTKYLTPVSEFVDARDGFVASVTDWQKANGIPSEQAQKVKEAVIAAWTEVGIGYENGSGANQNGNITGFRIPSLKNEASPEAQAVIDLANSQVVYYVPKGTDVSNLTPEILVSSGATVSPASGTPQDFSKGGVAYTVTSPNGATKVWNVFVVAKEDNTVGTAYQKSAFSLDNKTLTVEFNEPMLEFRYYTGAAEKTIKDKIQVNIGGVWRPLDAGDTAKVQDGKLIITWEKQTLPQEVKILAKALVDLAGNIQDKDLSVSVDPSPYPAVSGTSLIAAGAPGALIELYDAASGKKVSEVQLGAAENKAYFFFLPEGTYLVRQISKGSVSPASAPITIARLQSPANLRATEVTPQAVRLNWEPVVTGGPVSYAVYGYGEGGKVVASAVGVTDTVYSISGLEPGSYTFSVQALDAAANRISTPAVTYVNHAASVTADTYAPFWSTYAALGDSLAAGVTPEGKLDLGYTDYIAAELIKQGQPVYFDKRYAAPGYTSGDVLSDLKRSVTRAVYGLPGQGSIADTVRTANLITLNAGANDLLFADQVTGGNLTEAQLGQLLASIGSNIGSTLDIIKELNPDASVFVMGYYNPYPHAPEARKQQAQFMIGALNRVLKEVAEKRGAKFVDTMSTIAADESGNLPNPQNIHPSLKGYEAIAAEFLKVIPAGAAKSKLTASGQTSTGLKLTWEPAVDLAGVTQYRIYRDDTVIGTVYGEAVSYDVTGLKSNSTYKFKVEAGDAAGNWSSSGPNVSASTTTDPATSGGYIGGGGGGAAFVDAFAVTGSGVTLKAGSYSSVQKTENGQFITEITLDGAKLAEAFQKLKTLGGGAHTITLEVDTKQGVTVIAPGGALLEGLKAVPDAALWIKTGTAGYNVPLNVVPADIAEQLKSMAGEVLVRFGIRVTPGSSVSAIKLQGDLYGFDVTAAGKGGTSRKLTIPANRPGTITLTLEGDINEAQTSLVGSDGSQGPFRPAPALFKEEGGKTVVTVARNVSPAYGAVVTVPSFSDLVGHWSKEDVERLAGKRVIEGTTDMTFEPESPMTRAQFATLLVRAIGVEPGAETGGKFTDVTKGAWYSASVSSAVYAGLIEGFEDGTFQPDASITRAQMATMLSRALKFTDKKPAASKSLLDSFADKGDIGEWAEEAVAEAVQAGIIQGMTETTFAPTDKATRAQAAVMLKRMLTYIQYLN